MCELVLQRDHEMTQAEITDAMGISLKGVEKLLARAYRLLVQFREDTRAANAPDPPSDSHRNATHD